MRSKLRLVNAMKQTLLTLLLCLTAVTAVPQTNKISAEPATAALGPTIFSAGHLQQPGELHDACNDRLNFVNSRRSKGSQQCCEAFCHREP